MLNSLESFRGRCRRTYGVGDLSLIVAVRAHDHNPWVKERLRALSGYYAPQPTILIVDFGSEGPHRGELRAICESAGFRYVFVDDTGTFSLAKARNIGAAESKTELLFFSDIDCFGERGLCRQLVDYCNDIELGAIYDQIVKMPVYHLAEECSLRFFAISDQVERSGLIGRALARSVYGARDADSEFVDPSSNFFVCRRDFYDHIGGYNEEFRGHGSEDYEFLLRFAMWSGQFPMPAEPSEDAFGPTREGFYGVKPYRGFRRLGELMSYHAEVAGLRIAHLHHPRPRADDAWYGQNDWKRSRFHEQVRPFLDQAHRLLDYDWMPREKTALVLLKHTWHYEFYAPLRAAGYRLVTATLEELGQDTQILDLIVNRQVDAVAMFNPYMKSHTELRSYFECARQSGLDTIVVERGALPDSWYYATEVSYGDPTFSETTVDTFSPTDEERGIARDYIEHIRAGGHTLESNGLMARTSARYAVLGKLHPRICFVPLQLDDDMAVTRFNEGYTSYATFRDSILDVAASRPDVLFFVKPHPLSARRFESELENVKVCGNEDNVHALIELAHAVVVYNSGVGLLSLLHGRRVVTIGNAFYNMSGLGRRADSFAEAVDLAFADGAEFLSRDVEHFVAWLLFRKYSFFSADSVIRDFGHRRSHEYRNLRCYQLGEPGSFSTLRARVEVPFDLTSYASARLGVGIEAPREVTIVPEVAKHGKNGGSKRRTLLGLAPTPGSQADMLRRKLDKLRRNPERFFADSKIGALRWIGRRVVTQDES